MASEANPEIKEQSVLKNRIRPCCRFAGGCKRLTRLTRAA
jgi:hypothetical protein